MPLLYHCPCWKIKWSQYRYHGYHLKTRIASYCLLFRSSQRLTIIPWVEFKFLSSFWSYYLIVYINFVFHHVGPLAIHLKHQAHASHAALPIGLYLPFHSSPCLFTILFTRLCLTLDLTQSSATIYSVMNQRGESSTFLEVAISYKGKRANKNSSLNGMSETFNEEVNARSDIISTWIWNKSKKDTQSSWSWKMMRVFTPQSSGTRFYPNEYLEPRIVKSCVYYFSLFRNNYG